MKESKNLGGKFIDDFLNSFSDKHIPHERGCIGKTRCAVKKCGTKECVGNAAIEFFKISNNC